MLERHLNCLGPSGFHALVYSEWPEPVVLCVHGLTRNAGDLVVSLRKTPRRRPQPPSSRASAPPIRAPATSADAELRPPRGERPLPDRYEARIAAGGHVGGVFERRRVA
jgi:hypothetical protein